MNPKSINDLDPKLKETYERVMGTTVPAAQPPKMESQPVPPIQPPPSVQPASPSHEDTTVAQVFRADSPFKEAEPPPPDVLVKTSDSVKVEHKNKSLLPVALALGAIIFFAAYAVIWAKLLGLF